MVTVLPLSTLGVTLAWTASHQHLPQTKDLSKDLEFLGKQHDHTWELERSLCDTEAAHTWEASEFKNDLV